MLAGCGKAAESGSSTGLPSTIELHSINELTGPAGIAGVEIQKGYDLAIKKINETKLLGNTTLKISYDDTGGKPAVGASFASKAVAASYPIVFGSPVGADALAEAPILAKAKQPTIFNEAASNGVIAGPTIYRMTPVLSDYYNLTLEYLKSKNVKTLAILTNSDQPSLQQMAQEAKDDAAKYGYTVVSSDVVVSTQTDVAATVSKIAAAKPDAVAALVQTGQNSTVVKQLSEAGYTGLITSSTSAGGGALKAAGAAANGVVWATNYTYQQTGNGNEDFVKAFNAAYGTNPTNWAATAYDAMFFAARSLAEAKSVDKAAVAAALQKVGTEGFTGIRGDVKVKDGQQVASGVMVRWQDGNQVPVTG
ncbi:ABC transporter substrate-binding protein [Dactylosporangium sp. CA-139066]|uniref:ABC transporter substrate-binding protein n=1 Tax=Dactylosporangium sp. CA-139066 TaxID=3239930 RepID=UPI003D936A38